MSVNAAALPPDRYYGLVRVDSPGVANTPQLLTSSVQVLRPDAAVGEVVEPAELLFTAVPGGGSPGSQNVLVYSLTPGSKIFRSSIVTDAGLPLIVVPRDATVDPQQPARVVVQPLTTGLGPGIYSGAFTLQFSDGYIRSVKATVIVPNATNRLEQKSGRGADAGCTPTKLLPTLTTLAPSFAVSAGWPVALKAEIKDDCGVPLEAGSASVTFDNGDPPVLLRSTRAGFWEGTWATSNTPRRQVTVTLQADDPSIKIRGQRSVSGALESQQDAPVFDRSGIVSAAGGPPYVALAPGGIISISGDRLAENAQQAGAVPLPTRLVDTEVIMADQRLPLYYVDQHRVNAIVPYGLNVNITQQVLVRRGLTYSLPVAVDVAPAQPSIFVSKGYGIAYATRGGGPPFLVSPAAPAQAGDKLVIYCAGLGVTDPPAADGAISAPPARTKYTVTVTIGGQDASVLGTAYPADAAAFTDLSGFAPGLVGVYQVDVEMPSGVTPGDSVPVTFTVAGQTSPVANLAAR